MKRVLVLLALCMAIGLTAAFLAFHHNPQLPTPPIFTTVAAAPEDSLFTQVNQYRTDNSLPPLVETQELDSSAQAKCADMETYNYHSHDSPQGKTWQSFIPKHYKRGENIAWGYTTNKATLLAWEKSPEHNANLLRDYDSVGYATCDGPAGHLYVQHFAKTTPF